jgi:hypothetical protein
MHHIMNIAVIAAFTALASYACHESWKRGRYGWALFCMFWVGYNARGLFGML